MDRVNCEGNKNNSGDKELMLYDAGIFEYQSTFNLTEFQYRGVFT